MKLYLVLLLSIVSCYGSKHIYTIEKEQVFELIEKQEIAWNRGDLVGFMHGYWKDSAMQFVSNRGARFGWQATLSAYQKGYPTKDKMGELSFTELKYNYLTDNMGQVLGNWRVVQNQKDTLQGNFSLIFKQFESGPKIIIDHTW